MDRHRDDFAGCISEKILRARSKLISYSEWEMEPDIERYTKSEGHNKIVNHTHGVKSANR